MFGSSQEGKKKEPRVVRDETREREREGGRGSERENKPFIEREMET